MLKDNDLYKDYARLAYEKREMERWLKTADAKRKFLQRRCPFWSEGNCIELHEKCKVQCFDVRLYRFEDEGTADERLVRL